jgi:hypothetical protein
MLVGNICLLLFLLLPVQNNVRIEHTGAGNIIERRFHTPYEYTIRWGNNNFMRTLPDTFTVNGLNDPYFWYENNRHILLKVNTKKGHTLLRILPMNDTTTVRLFSDPLEFDKNTDLLACIVGVRKVKIIDLATGKTSVMTIPLPKGFKDLISSVRYTALNNKELRINWVNAPESVFKSYRIPVLK